MSELEPTCVWRITPEIITSLQERFGDPLDTYVNGSQVWLMENGPKEVTLQWRLHPVAGYVRPSGMETDEVFTQVAFAVRNNEATTVSLDKLWDGLEAWSAYGDSIDPVDLEQCCKNALGIAPDSHGMVDHRSIGDRWEREKRNVSIIEMLFEQLTIGQ